MQEKIINIVTKLVQDGIAAPTYWMAIFTDKRLIFLRASRHTVVELASPLANRIASVHEVEEIANSLKVMTVQQILDSEYEKVDLSGDTLKVLEIKERPDSFFRSIIKFPFRDKTVKLSTNRETIRFIKSSLHILNPSVFSSAIKPLHSQKYVSNISYAIRAIGLILLLWNVIGLFEKVGIKEVFLAVAGLFIFLKRKIGAYILAAAIISDFVLMRIFATNIDIEILLKDIIILVILAGVLVFLWKFKSELK